MGRQPVKSSAFFPLVLSGRSRWSGGLRPLLLMVVGLVGGGIALPARGQDDTVYRSRPLLLGGPVQQKEALVVIDPRLPVGELRGQVLPPLMKNSRCSLRRPVCVENLRGEADEGALHLLERAYEELSVGASLPKLSATPSRPLRWKLDSTARLALQVQEMPTRGFDVGQARCRGGAPSLENARRCIAEALVSERAPATAPWLRAGWGAFVADGLGDAVESRAELLTSFERPQTGVLTSSQRAPVQGDEERPWVSPLRSARFFSYLESRATGYFGHAGYLSLVLAATETPAGSARFHAEPDLADVIRASHRYDRSEVARFYDDFSSWSYFDARQHGAFIEPDWRIDATSLPRSLAFPSPMEPTGAIYALVRLPEATRKEVIGFRMSCETPVSYAWSVSRLGAKGQLLSQFPITFQERKQEASGRVLPAPGVEELLVVGTNLGGVALTHPFDPDHEPHEAHGCTLTIDVVPSDSTQGATSRP